MNAKWPLVSWTHDMLWTKKWTDNQDAQNTARTLEIVLKKFSGELTTDCNSEIQQAEFDDGINSPRLLKRATDRAAFIVGTKEGHTSDKLDGQFTKGPGEVWTQTTIGVKSDAFLAVEPAKLFARSSSAGPRQALFTKVQTAVVNASKSGAAFERLPAKSRSLILYAAYAILSYLKNAQTIDWKLLDSESGRHFPEWKNAFVLYPKTSVAEIVKSLGDDAKAQVVYDQVAQQGHRDRRSGRPAEDEGDGAGADVLEVSPQLL